MLTEFRAEYPGVDIRLYQSSAAATAKQLHTGDVDLCFASQPLPGPGLRRLELLREEVLLAVPPGHRLAGRERVRLEDVAGEQFVTTRPGYWPRELAARLFAAAGLRPPEYTPGSWLHLDAPDCYRSLSLVWRANTYFSVAAQRLADFASDYFDRLSQGL